MGVLASRFGCSFGSLPDELLCTILGSERLSFKDRIACQRVCQRWRLLLASPKAGAGKIWGEVRVTAANAVQLCSSSQPASAGEVVQPASLKVLVALGRWLVARAPGLQKLVLDLYRDPFMGDRRPAAALHDSVATTLVAVLLALLEDTRVVMHLILPGTRAGAFHPLDLLSDSCAAAKLVECVVALDLSLCAQNSLQDFVNLCCLRGLTQLNLVDEARVLLEVPPEIGQLTGLIELHLSSNSEEAMALPPEISGLQKLESMSLGGFTSCDNIFSLGKLARLSLTTSMHLDIAAPVHVPQACTSLSSLRLQDVCLGESIWGLSCLIGLRELSMSEVAMAWNSTVEFERDISAALGVLTTLSKLDMTNCEFCVDVAALGALTGLKCLYVSSCGLQDFACCSGWRSLTHLQLDRNELTHLPSNLSSLTALVELSVCDQVLDIRPSFQLEESLCKMIDTMPALRTIRLAQDPVPHPWNAISVYHLLQAKERVCHIADFQLIVSS